MRERETDTQRDTETERETDRDGQTDRQTDREITDRDRVNESERERE